jgi:hypothetical protein
MVLKGTIIDDSILDNFSGQERQYLPPVEDIPKTTTQFKQRLYSNPVDEKQHIRKAFNDLYKGVVMTKTNEWNQEPYGVYGIYKARLASYTMGDDNIIIAIVPNDELPLGTRKLIDSLSWISFQTRTMTNIKKDLNGFNLPIQSYMIKGDNILNDRIKVVKETSTKYVYNTSNLPLKVEILKVNEDDSFSEEGTIISALEVFQTVITLE